MKKTVMLLLLFTAAVAIVFSRGAVRGFMKKDTTRPPREEKLFQQQDGQGQEELPMQNSNGAAGAAPSVKKPPLTLAVNPFGAFCHDNLAFVKELGAKWTRYPVSWGLVEPSRGNFRWDRLEKGVAKSEAYGITVVPNIQTGKLGWATSCPTGAGREASCVPKNLDDYYNFLFQIAKRFKGRVEHMIIENEASSGFYFTGEVDDYLAMRRTAYKATHDANPNAKVVDSGFAAEPWGIVITREMYDAGDKQGALQFVNGYMQNRRQPLFRNEDELVKELYSAGGQRQYDFVKKSFRDGASFDIANIHFYEPSEYLDDVILWVKQEMQKNGYQKPIWITELGVKDKFHKIPREKVVAEVSKKHDIALAHGVEVLIWFRTYKGCAPNPASESDEPLFDVSGKLLPAGEEYRRMVAEYMKSVSNSR